MTGTAGLLLHLSGPLQAWGSPRNFEIYPTHRWPSRAGLTGLLAAALGRPRDAANVDLAALRYTIRVDRPGGREADFHTVGGGYDRGHTPPTADGSYRKEGQGTILTERWYLTDAAFTVAVRGPAETLASCGAALRQPVFSPYLGRRSCPPDTPLLIRADVDDPDAELDRVPLHRDKPRFSAREPVTFVYDAPPEPRAEPDASLQDVPGPGRTFTSRGLWDRRRELPDAADAGRGTAWLTALTTYLENCR